MAKLKALRGSVGIYGRVTAGGIVDVDEARAEKLIKSGGFVRASEADIARAQKAQEAAMSRAVPGISPGFLPLPATSPSSDRLVQLVERGEMSRDKARELVSLELSLSTDEVRAFIENEANELMTQVSAAQADVQARAKALDDREAALDVREKDLDTREAAISEREKLISDPAKINEAIAPASKQSKATK